MPSRVQEGYIKANKSKWFKGVLGAAAVVGKQALEISKDLGKQAAEAYDEWRSEDEEHPEPSAPLFQVVTETGDFDRTNMNQCISGLGPAEKFVVFGIMGPQNTGKSTLLNHLVSSMSC